ncbi:MAG: RNA polymerase sigma factor [Patescibacteria group bacterium UBA2163]
MEYAHSDTTEALSDEELLQHSLQNPSTFEVLLTRYQKLFFERARYVVKDADEAEDVVQETFVRIYRFAPKFNGDAGTFKAWAMTILMNVARTKYQKQAKQWARHASLTPEHYESLASPSDTDAIYAQDIIERAFQFLPEDVSALLKAAYIDNLSYKEIAEQEGVSEGAIKTRVHRAKKVLREVVGEIV